MEPNYGVFVDIRQQDGSLTRMHYPMTRDSILFAEWVGVNEQMAAKFAVANSMAQHFPE